ncbi:VWA domain-containing protein [Arcobacter cryaerophilus gv. pseudocryaerophilus]|uniref:VWA domain-containing protein n=1 Tax=Arcobacter sp. DSM 115956 TaxID=3059426 RepID=A0AAU0PDS1_9BACT|nr:VWA domain-containing protein [Arcobacter sp. DSM 115956]
MANFAKIQSIAEGQFFVKDSLGNLTELKVGDTVSLNDTIVAASSNTDLSKIEILFDTNELITLSQGEQLLDATLLASTFGNEELAFDKQEVDETLNAWNNAQDGGATDMETAAGDVTEQATNAGDERAADGGALRSKFNSRDGASTNVESDLRDTSFGGGNTEEPQEQIPAELLNPVGTTTPTTPTTPTIPVDTRVPASVITLSDPTVDEGNQITITATVTNPPQTDLIITLNNGQTITIPAGQTTGSVKFDNPNSEDVYVDNSTETYTITGTTGGNYVSLDTSDQSNVIINDTIDTTTVKLTSTGTLTEDGGDVTYSVDLGAGVRYGDTPVTVTFKDILGNEKTITINPPANQGDAPVKTGSITESYTEAQLAREDVYVENIENLSATDATVTGGNFEKLGSVAIENNVTLKDSEDTTTVKLTSTGTLTEDGGDVTYSVDLGAGVRYGDTPVTVTFKDILGNEKTITINPPANQGDAPVKTGSITESYTEAQLAREDVYVENIENLSATDATVTGGNFEKLGSVAIENNVTLKDSEDTTTVKLTSTGTLTEDGGDVTYSVDLGAGVRYGDTPVTVTFKDILGNEKTITINPPANQGDAPVKTGSITESYTEAQLAREDVYVENIENLSATDATVTGGNFEKLGSVAIENNVTLKDSEDTTTVKLTSTGTLTEDGGDVTYSVDLGAGVRYGDTPVTVTFKDILGNEKTITINPPANQGDAPVKTGSITESYTEAQLAREDVYVENIENLSATDATVTGGNFEKLGSVAIENNVTLKDSEDTTTVKLTSTGTLTEDGGDVTYSVDLGAGVRYGDTPVTVTFKDILGNEKTITINPPANQGDAPVKTGSITESYTEAQLAREDVYVENIENLSATDATVTGGNFEKLGSVAIENNVTLKDSEDTTTVKLTSTGTLTEDGGDVTYSVDLGAGVRYGDTPVTVTFKDILGNEKTITINPPANQGDAPVKTGSITESYTEAQLAREDVYVENIENLSATDATVTGGNFEKLGSVAIENNVTLKDSEDTTTVKLTSTGTLTEDGGDVTYSVDLGAGVRYGDTPVTVTFKDILGNEKTITINPPANQGDAPVKTGSITESYTEAQLAREDVYVENIENLSATDATVTGGNFEKLGSVAIENNVTLKDSEDTTTVKLTSTGTLTEDGGDVTYSVDLGAGVRYGDTPVTVTFKDILGNEKTITINPPANQGDAPVKTGSITESYTEAQLAREDVYVENIENLSATDATVTGGNFEKLGSVAIENNVTLKDSEDTTTVKLTSTGTLTEDGGDVTYSVDLGAGVRYGDTPVTVTFKDILGNEKTITINPPANQGDAPVKTGSITESYTEAQLAREDVYVENIENLSATDATVTGGNFEKLGSVAIENNVTLKDSEDTTTVKLTSTGTLTEDGGDVTYSVDLGAGVRYGDTPVTVTFKDILGNEKTITINPPANQGDAPVKTGSITESYTEAQLAREDVYVENIENLSATDATVTGGNFEKLGSVAIENNVTLKDSEDTTTVKLTSTGTLTEDGGDVTYSVDLGAGVRYGDTPVTVTFKDILGNEKTITINPPANQGDAPVKTGSITESYTEAQLAREDVYVENIENLSATDATVTGGNFEKLGSVAIENNVTLKDSEDTTTVKIEAAKVTDKVITKDNFENNAGFTVKAKDPYGNDAKISTHTGPAGFGVESFAETNSGKLGQTDQVYSGHTSEIGVVKDGSTYKSESIEVEFKNPVHTLDVAFAWRHNGETAKVDFYNGNEKVGYAIVKGGGSNTDAIVEYYIGNETTPHTTVNAQGGTDNVDLVYTFKPAGDVTFTKAVFSADGAGSDYLIHSISYKEVSEGDSTTIVGSDEVAFKISTSNIPDPSKYDFINTFPTADVKIVDKNTGEDLFNGTVNLDKDGKAIVTVRTDGTKDLIAEVSNVQGNFEEVDYKNAKTEVEASIKASASNDSFNTLEDTNYVLKTTDFGDNNQNVAKIKFDSVPANGTIYVLKSEYTGSINDRAEYTSSENKVYIEVKAGDIVDISKIENGNVVFVPNKDTDADSSFKFSVSNGNGVFSNSYETKVNVIAVADAPTVSIDITKIGATTISTGNTNGGNSGTSSSFDKLIKQTATGKDGNLEQDIQQSNSNQNIEKDYQNVNANNITTGLGNDTLKFQALNNKTITTGEGNDKVIIDNGSNNNQINVGNGNNEISITHSLNQGSITAGSGNDTLFVGNAADGSTINMGAGNDKVQIDGDFKSKVYLGAGDDKIALYSPHTNFEADGRSYIDGGNGFDTLYVENLNSSDFKVKIKSTGEEITWEKYSELNNHKDGEANIEFVIHHKTNTNQGFVVKNIEQIVFKDKTFGEKDNSIKAVAYKVDISAALTDTDGSETLSVVIKNVPTGAVLESTKYDVSKNSDGSWSVNFKEGTTGDALLKIEDSLTMKVPESYKGEINLEIVGRSTENDYTKPENEDGKNYAESKATDGIKTVYVKLEGDATTKEGGDLVHNLKLVDAEGKIVNIKSGEEITVNLKYTSEQGTVDSKDFSNGNYGDTTITLTSSTPRDANGNYIIKNTTKADGISEGTEKYSLEITGVSQKNNTFDDIRIDSTENKVTATIEEGLFFKGADHNVTLYNEQVLLKDGSDAKVTTNLVLTLDVSWSMVENNAGVNNSDINRLDLAKTALKNLINDYSKDGNTAMVNLTLFAKDSKNIGWMKAEDAIKYIDSIKIPSSSKVTSDYKVTLDNNGNVKLTYSKGVDTGVNSGGTNYEDAIGKTTAIDFSGHGADRTLAFFISDGEPTVEAGSSTMTNSNFFNSIDKTTDNTINGQTYGRVDKEYYDKWSGFVNSNTIGVTTVIGLGKLSAAGQDYLNMMAGAYNGEAIFVGDKDVKELMSALAKDGSVSGTIFSEVENKSGSLSIESIKFDGTSYTKPQYDLATKNSEGLTSGDGKYKLSMNFETGEYKFTALVKEFEGNDNPSFDVTIKDSVTKETATGTVKFNVVSSDGEYNLGYSEIDGGAGYDVIKLTLGQDIDFSELGTVIKNIEQIDLSEKGENKLLNLSLKDVLTMTDKDNTLRITGTAEDKVTFKENDGWKKANSTVTEKIGEDTKTFEIYTNSGDPTVQVKVEDKISDGITS